jgi:hypothetical protein
MKDLWQLKRISTGEALNEPQLLPENWKNIFGLSASEDRLGDLSWAGHEDIGWFKVGKMPGPEVVVLTDLEKAQAEMAKRLEETDIKISQAATKEEKIAWMDYQQKVKEVYLQVDYPKIISWPSRPE